MLPASRLCSLSAPQPPSRVLQSRALSQGPWCFEPSGRRPQGLCTVSFPRENFASFYAWSCPHLLWVSPLLYRGRACPTIISKCARCPLLTPPVFTSQSLASPNQPHEPCTQGSSLALPVAGVTQRSSLPARRPCESVHLWPSLWSELLASLPKPLVSWLLRPLLMPLCVIRRLGPCHRWLPSPRLCSERPRLPLCEFVTILFIHSPREDVAVVSSLFAVVNCSAVNIFAHFSWAQGPAGQRGHGMQTLNVTE